MFSCQSFAGQCVHVNVKATCVRKWSANNPKVECLYMEMTSWDLNILSWLWPFHTVKWVLTFSLHQNLHFRVKTCNAKVRVSQVVGFDILEPKWKESHLGLRSAVAERAHHNATEGNTCKSVNNGTLRRRLHQFDQSVTTQLDKEINFNKDWWQQVLVFLFLWCYLKMKNTFLRLG